MGEQDPKNTFITRNAMEGLRAQHPTIGVRGALLLLARATPVTPDEAAVMLKTRKPCKNRYFLSDDRRGLFVVADNRKGHPALIAYIALGEDGQRTDAQRVYITPHALERLREHHPQVGAHDARAMLERASPMDPGLVAAILQRKISRKCQDIYRLAEDTQGIFVIVNPNDPSPTLVTYIRLSESQQALLR